MVILNPNSPVLVKRNSKYPGARKNVIAVTRCQYLNIHINPVRIREIQYNPVKLPNNSDQPGVIARFNTTR